MRPVYVICFDISDDRLRTQIGKRLLKFGNRVQKSVFEVQLDSAQQADALRLEFLEQLDDADKLHFYRLCLNCRKQSMNLEGESLATFPATLII